MCPIDSSCPTGNQPRKACTPSPLTAGRRLGGLCFKSRGVRGVAKSWCYSSPLMALGWAFLILHCWPKSSCKLGGIENPHLFSYPCPGEGGEPSCCLLHIRTGAGVALWVCDQTGMQELIGKPPLSFASALSSPP